MPKISQYPNGGEIRSTDKLVIARAGQNYSVEGGSIYASSLSIIPGGRLTLTSGTPVTTSDVTGATSIYYTPFQHNAISLWNGTEWQSITFTEKTLTIGTVTSGLPYDVFGYLSSGDLALEKLAWTNGTTRATGLTIQDGRYCKSGDKTRLYLGTFYTTSTTATEDSVTKRFLFNAYNRRSRRLVIENATSHNYNVATVRAFNNDQPNSSVQYIVGLQENDMAFLLTGQLIRAASDGNPRISFGVNSTTSELGAYGVAVTGFVGRLRAGSSVQITPSLGYSYICALEFSTVGTAPGTLFEAALLNSSIMA